MAFSEGNENVVSLPLRERGLKYLGFKLAYGRLQVAPFTGAWIEI